MNYITILSINQKQMRIIEIDENSMFSELGNFAPTPFNDGVDNYKSVLHAYYAYLNNKNRQKILSARTIENLQEQVGFDTYKKAASKLYHPLYFNYGSSVAYLRTILFLKVSSNVNVKNALLLTGDAELHIINGSDLVLGVGKSRMGLNLTGLHLMEIRSHFEKCRGMTNDATINLWMGNTDCSDSDSVCSNPQVLTDCSFTCETY